MKAGLSRPLYLCCASLLLAMTVMSNAQEVNYSKNCPCSNPQWCKLINDTTRKEVFAFSVNNDENHWNKFDWSKITTVVMFGYLNQSLMCLAHSHNARAVILGGLSVATMMNTTLRNQWIENQVKLVQNNFLDGINFDFEGAILPNQTDLRKAYTDTVSGTSAALKAVSPFYQISVDVGWAPNIDLRFFDYVGLAAATDFLFVMAYDEQSQIFGECLAMPNSGFNRARLGLERYLNLSSEVLRDKLVLGIPWYGYSYPCISRDGNKCLIKKVPFRGVACSDSAGKQINYGTLYYLIKTLPDYVFWNSSSLTPYIMHENKDKTYYQVQYDDPKSLSIKYGLAAQMGLKGVGMWNIDSLDYSDTASAEQIRQEMFGALPARN